MGVLDRLREGLERKSPWLAAFLNVMWGLGYLYAGKKKLVGVSLLTLIAAVQTASVAFLTGSISARSFQLVLMGSMLFVSLALARDAYIETKKRNEKR